METGWHEIHSEIRLDSPFLSVIDQRMATPSRPDGVDWVVVRRKRAIVVAPRTPQGGFLLIRQERVPARATLWEFPAGQIDHTGHPNHVEQTVHRELAEETGCQIHGAIHALDSYWTSPGFTDERCFLFLAEDVRPFESNHRPDADEMILEVREFSSSEIWRMIADGTICDANTLATMARLIAGGWVKLTTL